MRRAYPAQPGGGVRVKVQATLQSGPRLELFELVAVERVLLAAGRDEYVRLDVGGARAAMAQHRHQRHQARAAAHEQQRAALVDRPREVPADRPAQLEWSPARTSCTK